MPDSTTELAAMRQELAEMRATLQDRLANDQTKEKAFDSLYAELKQYKDDFIFQSQKSLLLDLLLFYDSMSWFQESLVGQEASPEVIADSFQYLVDEFLEVLYRRDVLPVEEADTFDRQIHKAVKVENTDDERRDYKIAQVLKRGFRRGERSLRAEEVVIYRARDKNSGGRG
ncbi:MAG: molecular chaperone GrpE (heat shock protein) [Myxococcota bacterium]